jgi:hypothetical protein
VSKINGKLVELVPVTETIGVLLYVVPGKVKKVG